MAYQVTLLRIASVVFCGFGIGFAAVPNELADFLFGSSPATPSASIDMRATYGGVALGVGIFMWLCAGRTGWLRPGLLVTTLVLGALAVTRLIGIAADGSPNGYVLLFLVMEIGGTALAATAMRRTEVVSSEFAAPR